MISCSHINEEKFKGHFETQYTPGYELKVGALNVWKCKPGYIHSLEGEKQPVRQLKVGCFATAVSFNETRGHEWRSTESDQSLEPCIRGEK